MNLTRAQEARLGRKRFQPERQPDELVAIFVPGKLTNPLNARQQVPWFAGAQARYKREWKERVAQALLEAGWKQAVIVPPSLPKRITFLAIVPKAFDAGTDGLRAAMKPIPDALKGCGVIDDDRDKAGHEFVYTQEARRRLGTEYGVVIRVSLRKGAA